MFITITLALSWRQKLDTVEYKTTSTRLLYKISRVSPWNTCKIPCQKYRRDHLKPLYNEKPCVALKNFKEIKQLLAKKVNTVHSWS